MEREFEEIYRKYAGDLYKFILRLCGNETLAMDIMQDTMLKAITTIDRFNGDCSMKTYLCTIARNEYYDHLKRAEKRKTVPIDETYLSEKTAEDPDSAFEECIEDRDRAMRIHKALHRLDEPYREIFTLRVFAELRFSDIGAVFGQSENWARVSYYRAKKKLIELLKEDDQYE